MHFYLSGSNRDSEYKVVAQIFKRSKDEYLWHCFINCVSSNLPQCSADMTPTQNLISNHGEPNKSLANQCTSWSAS